jgi:molybdopterin converting factor small subunit
MNIRVHIPTAFRRFTSEQPVLVCDATDLAGLLAALQEKFPELAARLRDEQGQLRRFVNVYVNEEDIRFLGGATYRFAENDEVMLVPSIAGG